MYKIFFKIVVLITGILYIASFCEFDQRECIQNYDNETHVYIHNDNVSAKPIKLPVVFKQLYTVPLKIVIPHQNFISNQHAYFSPPVFQSNNKKYLFDSVFLI